MPDDSRLRGSHVAVLGLGIEGRDLCRFLRERAADVTIFDTRPRELVAGAAAEAEASGARVVLGQINPDAAAEFEAVYVSQSVLLHREPFVQRTRELGRPISSMLREFLHRWPGPVAGITGSSGKTTTTSLVAAMFEQAQMPFILGGNIGVGLLQQLERVAPDTWAVLEISHTQLQLLDRAPQVACVTNVTPNHLDQFDWDAYVGLKRELVRGQTRADVAVLNAADAVSRSFAGATAAHVVWFNARIDGSECFFLEGDRLIASTNGVAAAYLATREIPLRGSHNVENVLAASAVASAAGISLASIAEAVHDFRPVAHRLEPVAVVDGVAYVNDSIATSPERTLAGIRSFDETLVLLLGGREKKLPLDTLATAAHRRARAIVCFGEAGGLLEEEMLAQAPKDGPVAEVLRVASLPEAVAAAQTRALPGDVVLLSPACTSFDAYPNFERRGEEFRSLVAALAAGQGRSERKDGTPSPA